MSIHLTHTHKAQFSFKFGHWIISIRWHFKLLNFWFYSGGFHRICNMLRKLPLRTCWTWRIDLLLFYRCRHFSKLKLNVWKRSKQRRHVSSSTHDLFCSIRKHSIGSNRTETERHQFHKKHLILSFSLIQNPITAAAAK